MDCNEPSPAASLDLSASVACGSPQGERSPLPSRQSASPDPGIPGGGGHASGVDYAALSVGGAEAVAAWLAALGMGEYSDAFAHAAVDGKALPLREIAEM